MCAARRADGGTRDPDACLSHPEPSARCHEPRRKLAYIADAPRSTARPPPLPWVINRASIGRALDSLANNADTIDDGEVPRLTDPVFEYWLKARGLTPESDDNGDD